MQGATTRMYVVLWGEVLLAEQAITVQCVVFANCYTTLRARIV